MKQKPILRTLPKRHWWNDVSDMYDNGTSISEVRSLRNHSSLPAARMINVAWHLTSCWDLTSCHSHRLFFLKTYAYTGDTWSPSGYIPLSIRIDSNRFDRIESSSQYRESNRIIIHSLNDTPDIPFKIYFQQDLNPVPINSTVWRPQLPDNINSISVLLTFHHFMKLLRTQ